MLKDSYNLARAKDVYGSDLDDAILYFTTGCSKSGRTYFRSANDGLDEVMSDATSHYDFEPTLTQQQFKDDTDPNVIMERFARTGDLSALAGGATPQWGVDIPVDSDDYHKSLNLVIEAQNAFDALPAKVRSRFDNDPAQLMEFVADDRNRAEAVELGLIAPEKVRKLSPAPKRASDSAGAGAGGNLATPPAGGSSSSKKAVKTASGEE